MRREAERRFAAGDAPHDVISDLRGRHGEPTGHRSIGANDATVVHPGSVAHHRPELHAAPMAAASLIPPELPPGFVRDPIWPLSEWWIDDT